VTAETRGSGHRPLSALVVAGTHSGVGKTTVTLGLIAALRRRGLTVQPFKVGPDFIDPLHHTEAAGRRSLNLDGWMLEPEVNRRRFARAVADADVALVEGVMGLFDGSEGGSDRGSAAEMARLLGLPVLLLVDASAMARSAAALIHGFTTFDPDTRVAGVILNRVGGEAHADMIRAAVGETTPILGALPRVADLAVPERHLGLHLPHEAGPDHVARAADLVAGSVDLDALLAATSIPRPAAEAPPEPPPAVARLAVARDEAFCFYNEDNLDLLRRAGAELVEFSPLRDPLPRGVDGVYLGGGYPELHAEALAGNRAATGAIRDLAAAGGPIYAECGGLMYLGQHLRVDGRVHPQCGVLPFSTRMPAGLKLAYVEVATGGGLLGAGRTARGHLFHHSEIEGQPEVERCWRLRTTRGEESLEGYRVGNVLASYVHLHFESCPALAAALVGACVRFRQGCLSPDALRRAPV
jgi:cobyrinic acid a,c-diamide synthase